VEKIAVAPGESSHFRRKKWKEKTSRSNGGKVHPTNLNEALATAVR